MSGYINKQTDKSAKLQIKRKVTNWWLCITVLESFHSGIQRHSSLGGQLMLLALYLNKSMYHHHTLLISNLPESHTELFLVDCEIKYSLACKVA